MLAQETIKKLAQEIKDAAEAWQAWENATEDYDESVKNTTREYMQNLAETLTEAVRNDENYPEPETTSWSDEDEKAVISHASTLSDEIYELYEQNDDDDYYLVSKAFEALSTLHEKELPYVYETPDQLFIEFCDEIASANE